ncbi:MAG: hypothetical protein EAZ14_06460 [Runella slithyformis]|nr:MAG: hypothetical protein EAZ14_06460 [Runella slithyformis]
MFVCVLVYYLNSTLQIYGNKKVNTKLFLLFFKITQPTFHVFSKKTVHRSTFPRKYSIFG